MADTIMNPVPSAGNDFQYNLMAAHYCQLSSTKLLSIVVQTNPNFVFAYVTNLTNMKTGTFSSANGPMRAILAGSSVPDDGRAYRLFKLSSNRALMVITGNGATNPVKLYVIEVTAGDDIIVKNASLTTGVLTQIYTSFQMINWASYSKSGSTYNAVGSYWQLFSVRDNVIYVADRDATVTNNIVVRLRKLTYDPAADSLTNTLLSTYTGPSPAPNLDRSCTRMYVQDIPGSTSKLYSLRIHFNTVDRSASMANSTIAYAAIVSDTDVVTPLAGTLPAGLQALAPLSTTSVLGFTNNRNYLTWNGSAWNSTPATFSANGGTQTVVHAFGLDANYFMLFSAGLATNDLVSAANTMSVRVGRFISATSGQTSTATTNGDGASLGTVPYVFGDQNFIFRDGTDAFHLFGRPGTNLGTASLAPVIKTIYQQGG